MTCIVGLEHKGAVYIGGDSAAVAEYEIRKTALRKVFKKDGLIIGYTSSFRMGQLLQYEMKLDKIPKKVNMEYMNCRFIPAVRKCLRDGGYLKVDDNVEEGGQFLVGLRGQLYEIDSDFQVNKFRDGMATIGCGSQYALGSLQTSKYCYKMLNVKDGTIERIKTALKVASQFSSAVCPPFVIENTLKV